MLTDLSPGRDDPPLTVGTVVSAPFVATSALTGAAAEANPDLRQDAVDSLFD